MQLVAMTVHLGKWQSIYGVYCHKPDECGAWINTACPAWAIFTLYSKIMHILCYYSLSYNHIMYLKAAMHGGEIGLMRMVVNQVANCHDP